MYLKKYYDHELWKEIVIPSPFKEKMILEISNHGRFKKTDIKRQKIIFLKTGLTEGYTSVSVATTIDKSQKDDLYFKEIRKHIFNLRISINRDIKKCNAMEWRDSAYYQLAKKIEEDQKLLDKIRSEYLKKYRAVEKARRRFLTYLIHRLVAIYFIEQPSKDHGLIAHLDYDKQNNHYTNLQWMTRAQITLHQKSSPYVIKHKAENGFGIVRNAKLTESSVSIIKKRINENVPLRVLAKNFKISETQLLRIKRGINWANVMPAR